MTTSLASAARAWARRATGGSMRPRDLVSWPIARACARERSQSAFLWILAVLFAWIGYSSAPIHGGADLFGGKSFGELLAVVFTLVLGAGIVADELESGHAGLVLLRPVSRAAWFGGRLIGAGLVLLCALGLCWLLAWVPAVRAGTGLGWTRLLSLPLGFLCAFAWLTTLAALSVVARGATNAGWLILGAAAWFFAWASASMANAVQRAATQGGGLAARVVELIKVVHPYVGPQDPTGIQIALQTGQRADWQPLVWDLAWTAAAWAVGVHLLSRRELGRRRL
jgi:hypothetical protein